MVGRRHRVVPAVEGEDLGLGLLSRPVGRVEQSVEGDRCSNVGPRPRDVERALAAEAIAGNDQLAALHFRQVANLLDDRQQAPPERHAVIPEPCHLAEHDVALRSAELLAENVRDEGIVTELDQLLCKAQLEIRHAHHRRNEDDRRPRLSVAPPHEYAFQLLAFELERNRCLLAHSTSFAIAASFATVFMLRAVPPAAAGSRSFDRPIPLG